MLKVVQPIGIAYATVVTAYVFPVIPFKKVLRAKKVQVRGFLLRCDQEPLLLCTELLESYPPQCGGPSLVVDGLDMDTLADITRGDDCAWSARPVELQGVVDASVGRFVRAVVELLHAG